MAVKKVLRMGHPILRSKAEVIPREELLSPEYKSLYEDMLDTMQAEDGVGIAAPQIGISKRVVLVQIDKNVYSRVPESGLLYVINPEIEVLNDNPQGYWEGCLSVPGLRGFVERPRRIKVDFLDERGEEHSLVLKGFMATVFQHEIDHLDGILYIDRIKDTKKLGYGEEFLEFLAPRYSESEQAN